MDWVKSRQVTREMERFGSCRIDEWLALIVMLFAGMFFFPGVSYAQKPMGINLAGINDWSSELVFNDIFLRARAWRSVNQLGRRNNTPLHLDENGWVKRLVPGQYAETYIFAFDGFHLPKSRYRCFYHGIGEFYFSNGVKVLKKGDGWLDIKFDQKARFVSIKITKVDPNDYIRDIHILPYDQQGEISHSTFRSDFLERWKPFKVSRFLDWMRTNSPHNAFWSERPSKQTFSQASKKGVALEYMLEYSNLSKSSPWFCMPYAASDAYIRNFAKMVKARLDPSLTIYIEYSNEVWNGLFPAHQYAIGMGQRLGLAKDKEKAWLRYYTHRSLQVYKIWQEVFGKTDRLVRVLSSQAAVPWRGRKTLEWEDAYKNVDAFAIAPYFDARQFRSIPPGGVIPSKDVVLDVLEKSINDKKKLLSDYYRITQKKGVKLIAYEGGQHLLAQKNTQLTALYTKINRDTAMYDLYLKYLKIWYQQGGKLFMHFSSMSQPSKYGFWGSLEWYDQPIGAKSKYAALIKVMNQ